MKISQVALAVSMAGISAVATANTERDLDSHEHGAAVLNVALDDGAVFMELETPWNNLVGFEHNPSTDEQKAQVAEAMKILVEQPERMFTLNGGGCTADKITVESSMDLEADGDNEHHDDEHHDDEHKHDDDEAHHDDKHHDDAHHDDDKHHDDAHHDDEKHHDDAHHDDDKHHDDDAHHDEDEHHDHDHDEHEGESHSSALVSYSYTCSDVGNLSSIAVNVFSLWSGFEELDVQLIGPAGQTGLELTANQSSIDTTSVQ